MAALALLGTLLSTLLIGTAMWLVLPGLGIALPFLHCMLFGALISPTDSIAVIGILQSAKAPKDMELVIAGKSLFNDRVGVVLFSLLLGILASGTLPTLHEAGLLLLREAGGGIVFGLPQGSAQVLTWGGLRGGISVALALSLPAGDARNTVLALTYCVVVFSILGQVLSIGHVVRASTRAGRTDDGKSRP